MSKMPPSFSIIIPTYRRPEALLRCMNALCRLEYPRPSFEVIVVDDGGDIPLKPLLIRFSNQLRMNILWQTNTGPAAARNFGARHASGDYLAFTDDDCQPEPQWLQALGSALESKTDMLVGGKTVNALTSNPYAQASQTIIDVVYAHYNSSSRNVQFFASNNMAVSAKTFDSVGGFGPKFRTSEDRDLCDRLKAKGCTLQYVPQAVIFHAHTLSLRSYWKQHSGYGRGAWLYHSARARRGTGQFKPDWSFYWSLLSAPFQRGPRGNAVRNFLLILIAQLANAAGCTAQGIRSISKGEDGSKSMDSKHQ